MSRHYYAAKHYYDVRFCNDYSTLFRFSTALERDQYVDNANIDECEAGNLKTEAVTRDEARRHFPNAFRMVGECHYETDERDWLVGATESSSYWCSTNIDYH